MNNLNKGIMNIWILNHYAGNMFLNENGRHYNFAKYLLEHGHKLTIICSNFLHNHGKNAFDLGGDKFVCKDIKGISFVFLKTAEYFGNGIARMKNMYDFYRTVLKNSNSIVSEVGSPDIIIGSSVHPLACLAGIKLGKRFNIPAISEIRDLWPETIVSMGKIGKNSLIAKILYKLEKYIYEKSDALIFTMEGGRQYIIDQGWESSINLDKVFYVNNGVDMETYRHNLNNFIVQDDDLHNPQLKKYIYCGSVREANNLSFLIDCFKQIADKDSKLLIWGDGNQFDMLQNKLTSENISNVSLKGRVDKKYVPFINSCAYVNVLHNHEIDAYKYGMSQNKFFEYLASGKPVFTTCDYSYNIINQHNCGLTADFSEVDIIANINKFNSMTNEEYIRMSNNARIAAEEFDFRNLTNRLLKVIDYAILGKKNER